MADFSEEQDAETAPNPGPLDPARVAARVLLKRALEAADISAEEAGRDGCICVVAVPDACWTDIARAEWGSLVRQGQRFSDGTRESFWPTEIWVAWAPDELPRPPSLKSAAERFEQSVATGRHCVGLAADASWLPSDLVHAADHRLTMPKLTGEDIGSITTLMCGHEPAETLSDEQAALLTPRLLRLARRIDQTADAYIVKLRELLKREEADRAVAMKASPDRAGIESPREAPTLARLHGMDEAVQWGMNLNDDLAAFKAGTLAWIHVDRGCLLSGPPGCGKTLFARALAATCEVPLVTGSYSTWYGTGSAHQGDLLKAMRKTFTEARTAAPCILFIDEIDSFPNRGTITHHYADWEIQVVNALLAEIDGVEGREGVVLVAACNHPDKLDPALLRSGRLDRHIRIRLPDRVALARILREHLGADLANEDLSMAAMAVTGTTGADCERLVRGARRRARAAGRDIVLADLLDEIGGIDERSPKDLWITAIHEAGHVVAVHALGIREIEMVSLHDTAERSGGVVTGANTSIYMRMTDVCDQLVLLLAGRAAEHEVFGEPSSGAGGRLGSDLAQATALAATADAAFGFDEDGGLVWRGVPDAHKLPDTFAADSELAGRVRQRLAEAYDDARTLIRRRLPAVHALAKELVARRVIDGPEAHDIVRRSLGDGGGQP